MGERIALAFAWEDSQVSPDGQRYAKSGGIVDAACRVCNHEQSADIDRIILERLRLGRETGSNEGNPLAVPMMTPSQIKKYNVTADEIDRHVIRHLAPVCAEIMAIMFPATSGAMIRKMEVLPEVCAMENANKLLARRPLEKYDIVERMGEYEEETFDDGAPEKWDIDEADDVKEENLVFLPSLTSRRVERNGKKYDTGIGYRHPIRKWTEERMAREIEKKTRDAVTFLDEMMTVRDMAYKVYEDIMEAGELKYYNTAVSAIHEVRGVMESLAKLSLIAQKLGDGDATHARKLSPAMKDMIRAMGITEDTPDSEIPSRMIIDTYDEDDGPVLGDEDAEARSTDSDASSIPDAMLETDPTTTMTMEQLF